MALAISTLDIVDDKWFLERSRVVAAGKMDRAPSNLLALSLPDDTVDGDQAAVVPFWKLTKPNLVGPSNQLPISLRGPSSSGLTRFKGEENERLKNVELATVRREKQIHMLALMDSSRSSLESADINNFMSIHEEAQADAHEPAGGGASDSANTHLATRTVPEASAYGAFRKMPMRTCSEEIDDVDFDVEPAAFVSKSSSHVEAVLSFASKKRRLRADLADKDNFALTMDAAAEPPVRKPRVSVRTRPDSTTVGDGCLWRKYGQKNGQGKSLPQSLLSLHCGSRLSCSKAGSEICRRCINPDNNIRRIAQPRAARSGSGHGVDDISSGQHATLGVDLERRSAHGRRPGAVPAVDAIRILSEQLQLVVHLVCPDHHPGLHARPRHAAQLAYRQQQQHSGHHPNDLGPAHIISNYKLQCHHSYFPAAAYDGSCSNAHSSDQ